MAKKKKGRLVPIKKTVLDTRIGRPIERTYYINPDKRKPHPKTNKPTDNNPSGLPNKEYDPKEIATKLMLCNW